MSEQEKMPLEEAKALLPKGSKVHTFRNSSFMLIGTDWSKARVISAMKKFGVGLSGPQATAMNHGLVLIDDTGPLFIETTQPEGRTACQPSAPANK